ncbi:MAG TPA: hypothetical protein VFQ10_01685 [Rubrobacter sp.]|nr:hypothetical protein [Rubrobacter sp.]
MTRLAVIGLGYRATAMIASMQAVDTGVSVRAVADPATESARRRPASNKWAAAGCRDRGEAESNTL